jgi:hypothetical protein
LVERDPELAHAQHQQQKHWRNEREFDRRGAGAVFVTVAPASDQLQYGLSDAHRQSVCWGESTTRRSPARALPEPTSARLKIRFRSNDSAVSASGDVAGSGVIGVVATFNREIGLAITGLAAAPLENIRVLLIYALHILHHQTAIGMT